MTYPTLTIAESKAMTAAKRMAKLKAQIKAKQLKEGSK